MNENSTWADAIVAYLCDNELPAAFGFPGESSLPLYLAYQRRISDIKHVLARSPRGAGYMADGFSRISGKLGVLDTPGGIGSPFIAPTLNEAKNSSVPLMVLASGTASGKLGKWATSECDQQALFGAISKKTFLANKDSDPYKLCEEAARAALSPRTGPVFLEFPGDYFKLQAPTSAKPGGAKQLENPQLRPEPSAKEVEQAARIIKDAEKVVILAGGGANYANASEVLLQLSRATKIPVATTLNGKGVYPETGALSLGVSGSKGTKAANRYIQEADCVLVLGSKLGDKSTNGYKLLSKQQVLHVDADPGELSPRVENYVGICADVRVFLEKLSEKLSPSAVEQTIPEKEPFWTCGMTHNVCEEISAKLPEEGILVADASVASGWAGAAVEFRQKGQRLINPRGSGSLSYALPAAIGAHFAKPESGLLAIGGDGGFAMALADLETATRYNVPLTYVLLNNSRLGLIDKHAEELMGGSAVSSEFYDVDWTSVAKGFGWQAQTIEKEKDVAKAIEQGLKSKKPTLLNVIVEQAEEAPDYVLTKERSGAAK